MRLKQMKEMELLRKTKEPEREQELASQGLGTWRTSAKEGTNALGGSSGTPGVSTGAQGGSTGSPGGVPVPWVGILVPWVGVLVHQVNVSTGKASWTTLGFSTIQNRGYLYLLPVPILRQDRESCLLPCHLLITET